MKSARPLPDELTAERHSAGHLKGVGQMIGHADHFAAHPQLVIAGDLRRHVAEREIAAIEIAKVVRVDAEAAGDADDELGRRIDERVILGPIILTPASVIPKGAVDSDPPRWRTMPNVVLKSNVGEPVNV